MEKQCGVQQVLHATKSKIRTDVPYTTPSAYVQETMKCMYNKKTNYVAPTQNFVSIGRWPSSSFVAIYTMENNVPNRFGAEKSRDLDTTFTAQFWGDFSARKNHLVWIGTYFHYILFSIASA